jgi:predicted HTH transcriptional regulator
LTIDDILKGENDRIEFKRELPDKSIRYMKSVVAFANSAGGRLVIGVEDATRKVVGVDTASVPTLCDSIANTISDSCTPQILPSISASTIDGKSVLLVDIYPGSGRPYYVTSLGKEKGIFIRVGGTTRPADAAIIKDLEMQGTNMSFDEIACVRGGYDEKAAKRLCKDVERYIQAADGVKKKVKPSQFERWGLVRRIGGKFVPTNGFMLLTDNPFRYARTQCGRFKGTTRAVFIDKREFEGPLYDQIEEAYNFVLKHINLGAVIEGIIRKDVYELPKESIREMIVNAVTHRNYAENSCVQVAVYDDRVEVTSPGTLYGSITIEQILAGTSKVRNKTIAEVFSRMRIIENWGTGIQRIINGCREYGIADPEFVELGTDFRVNIYRTKKESGSIHPGGDEQINEHDEQINEHLTSTDSAVLRQIRLNPSVTIQELVPVIGKSRATITRSIKALRETGVIRRDGSNKSGQWRII